MESFKKKIKNKKGITLVALVITIIILLILAGVAISQLTDSGLFEKAKLAKEKAKNAQELENSILKDYEERIANSRNPEATKTLTEEEYNRLMGLESRIAALESSGQSGSSGLAGTMTQLNTNVIKSTTFSKMELNDSIENYKFLVFVIRWC